MYSAKALCKALEEGLSFEKALSTLQPYQLRYIAKIPTEIYRASQQLGWRFFPAPRIGRPAGNHLLLHQATNDLKKLKQWARSRPRWALATGSLSGVFVMVVEGVAGQNSLITACSDDWNSLDRLRTQAGQRHFIFFAWPYDHRQMSRYVRKGLYILGEGDWLLMPPSRELNGDLHVYIDPQPVAQAAPWLLDLGFRPKTEAADRSPLLASSVFGNSQSPALCDDVAESGDRTPA